MINDKQNRKRELKPKLRFVEFRNAVGWEEKTLRDTCNPVLEKVGSAKLTPVSITAGFGFVAQTEKFGRDISGDQYKNYIRLKQGDFAYNKGNSKKYPQGYVCQLKEFDQAAAPNAFICFRLKKEYKANFLQGLFDQNAHGRQLSKYITSGARGDGLLNISSEDFFSIKVPVPAQVPEQQKIADCLCSIEEVITAEVRKLDALKAHKKGFMQQLFPGEGETVPRLRFPQFRDAGEWSSDSLGKIFETTSGGTPDRSVKEYWSGKIPWITTSLVDFNIIYKSDEFISEQGLKNSSAKIFPKGTILIAMYGQGKTRGKVAMLGIEAATNQACAAILPKDKINPAFVFLNLGNRYDEMRQLSNSGGQENLSQALIRELPFAFPHDTAEQQKISAALTSLDELITAQSQKIDALKTQKKGLMQQLFPVLDEAHV